MPEVPQGDSHSYSLSRAALSIRLVGSKSQEVAAFKNSDRSGCVQAGLCASSFPLKAHRMTLQSVIDECCSGTQYQLIVDEAPQTSRSSLLAVHVAVQREKFAPSVSLETFLLPLFLKLPPHTPSIAPLLTLLLMAKGDRWTAGRTASGKPNTSRVGWCWWGVGWCWWGVDCVPPPEHLV